jgi:hypothetical protein
VSRAMSAPHYGKPCTPFGVIERHTTHRVRVTRHERRRTSREPPHVNLALVGAFHFPTRGMAPASAGVDHRHLLFPLPALYSRSRTTLNDQKTFVVPLSRHPLGSLRQTRDGPTRAGGALTCRALQVVRALRYSPACDEHAWLSYPCGIALPCTTIFRFDVLPPKPRSATAPRSPLICRTAPQAPNPA